MFIQSGFSVLQCKGIFRPAAYTWLYDDLLCFQPVKQVRYICNSIFLQEDRRMI